MRYMALVISLVATLIPATALAADFTVTAPDMTAYVINGQANPTLTLHAGQTYTFAINSGPMHPFYIKTVQGNGTANQFNSGVTNNGATSGTLTFAVPSNAPSTLFYDCSVHAAMTGPIQVAAPVPATGALASAVLALILCSAGGFAVYRARFSRAQPTAG
jgi:plastocyanin